MPWTIYWDNGGSACGTWPHYVFSTEEEAEQAAIELAQENIAEGIFSEEGGCEALYIDEALTPDPGAMDTIFEQMPDYFNRHVAGDR